MIFGTQLCKWILIILVNLLRCVPCTPLTWWRHCNRAVHCVCVTLSPCCRERDAKSLSLQRCGHPICHIWIGWTAASGVSFKRGATVRGSVMWRSWKNVCWASMEAAAGPHHHRGSDCVVVWMHVFAWMVDILNINFEPLTFCCVLFVSSILVSLNMIDKHVQSANIVWKCYFCVWDFHMVW